MFKVVFYKSIWDGDTPQTSKTLAILQREENLPFVPSPTIELFWGRDSPQSPKRVSWDVERQTFSCAMDDEFPHEIGVDEYDFEWLVDNALQSGWQLVTKRAV